MSFTDFEYLLSKISPLISKRDTRLRQAIPAKIRLAITLRFLASGDSYRSLHYLFKISSPLISKIVCEVCGALIEVLKDQIKIPSNANEWLKIEDGFKKKFPHAVGAIDGKHILVQCPNKSNSDFFNYKRTFSIVLLALVDSNYNFLFADIGSQGRISDGGVFRNSVLWQKICSNDLNLPTACPIDDTDINIPYVFLADGAFALSKHVMKPYPGNHVSGSQERLFNTKLSQSRVVVENCFGILSSKFRVFRKAIAVDIENVKLITMTCILLHNFLRRSKSSVNVYTPPGTIDVYDEEGFLVQPGSWRKNVNENSAIRDLPHQPRRPPLTAVQIRKHFTEYFYNNRHNV